ncbi:carnitine O-palmitoyltransferase 2, mitochondrial-like isoform X2 [Struthio camelus]|uniref:carnitine O-palmitoyltransferase 2, mitochondrial isoform X2 n=1 Tax=Struthio camelus TaxID=8801 RepID=UPI003603C758
MLRPGCLRGLGAWRRRLGPAGRRAYWRSVGMTEGIVSQADTDHHFVHKSTIPTMHFQDSLPRLPIPKLEHTLKRYLAAQEPLLDDKQYRNTKRIAKEFEKGAGKRLHRELMELDEKNTHTSYISDPWFNMYLSAREPIVLNFNPFISLSPDPREAYNNQLIRATNLIISSIKFLNSLKTNYLRPDIYYGNPKWSESRLFKNFIRLLPTSVSWYGAYMVNAYPLDMSQYKRLFRSSRIPKINKDELFTSECSRHLLVMRNGHFYIFDVLDSVDNILHPSEIVAHLIYIIQEADRLPEFALSYLTTEDRNIWATVRQQLLEAGNGFDRHLFALKHLAVSRGEPTPDFFLDTAYQKINHNIISTSTLQSPAVNLGGFGPVVSDGFGIGYHVSDNWLGCNATSYLDEELQEFLRCLEYSLNDIFDILEGRPLM